jgi:hypothetical protein
MPDPIPPAPAPIHGWQWTLLTAFLMAAGAFGWKMLGPLQEWRDFNVVYTPAGLRDLLEACVYGIVAMLLGLGVDPAPFIQRAMHLLIVKRP